MPTVDGLAFNNLTEVDSAFEGHNPYSENAFIEFSPPASGGNSNSNINYLYFHYVHKQMQ